MGGLVLCVPLDNFRGILHNKGIKDKLDAWLTFLSVDEPEMIVKLIREYPQFKKYYEEIYQLCRNTEKVMEMFSKELLSRKEADLAEKERLIEKLKKQLDEKD